MEFVKKDKVREKEEETIKLIFIYSVLKTLIGCQEAIRQKQIK